MIQNSTPGCLPKENRNTDGKGCTHPHAHSGVPYDSQNRNTPSLPVRRRAGGEEVYIPWGYHLADGLLE